MNNFRRRIILNENQIIELDPITGRGFVNGCEVVDLGLPSGLLWATHNLNAVKETDTGTSCKYGQSIDSYSEYKGNENPLPSSVDIVTQTMGKGWRTPTKEDFEELINNTYQTRTTFFDVSSTVGLVQFINRTEYGKYVQFREISYNYKQSEYWSSTPVYTLQIRTVYVSGHQQTSTTISSQYRSTKCYIRGVYDPSL